MLYPLQSISYKLAALFEYGPIAPSPWELLNQYSKDGRDTRRPQFH